MMIVALKESLNFMGFKRGDLMRGHAFIKCRIISPDGIITINENNHIKIDV
jgi:hypothetical protein